MKVKEYKLQIIDLLFEKEKSIVEAQMKKQGEFGQKVFDYIYLPALAEKYDLLKCVIKGALTEEEAEILKTKHVAIISQQQGYEHCMETKASLDGDENLEYYCYNMEKQILDYVEITGDEL